MTGTTIIRGGTVIDGTGREPFEADVAVRDGRIAAVERTIAARGDSGIDARGKIVTPGFVDIHTHYDAQATWGSALSPTSWNGVTTALVGNCGVGFAPCLPSQRDMLVALMEGVEDIPEPVLTAGLPWSWQSFPEFMDVLGQRRFDIDVGVQVPHAALRVFVMDRAGAMRAPSSDEQRAEMGRLAAEGLAAGALGVSTSRTIAHKTLAGDPTPTLGAAEAELAALADAVARANAGWLQVVTDFDDPDEEFGMLERLAARAGRPLTLSLLQRESRPALWRDILSRITDANGSGRNMTAQVMGRPVGVMLGFEISQNPFLGRPSWTAIAELPFEEKMRHARDPAFRARLLGEKANDPVLRHRVSTWDKIFPLGDPPDYEPAPGQSVAAAAARLGKSPEDHAYDLLLERGGKAILYRPLINYADGDLDAVGEMMTHPHTLLGLGDGGAHVSIICDASAPTTTITHWTRDRTRGSKLPLAWAIRRLTRDNARAIGLRDRGEIRAGLRADINVIDYRSLRAHAPEVRYDLPAGGRRLVQRTEGYDATLVAGEVTYRAGLATGALPGRLVRGAR